MLPAKEAVDNHAGAVRGVALPGAAQLLLLGCLVHVLHQGVVCDVQEVNGRCSQENWQPPLAGEGACASSGWDAEHMT